MATEQNFAVTYGGKGLTSIYPGPQVRTLTSVPTERVGRTIQVLTPAFRGDPVYTWLLHTSDSQKHEEMLPRLFRGFFTQCALNNGIFIEVGDFGCCGLLMPPGAAVENPWTMLQAQILTELWTDGVGIFMVRLACAC